jgi:hypothetical protein
MTEQEQQQAFMQELTMRLDQALNGEGTQFDDPDKKVGFILLVFPLQGIEGNCTISCNGLSREGVAHVLTEQGRLLTSQTH